MKISEEENRGHWQDLEKLPQAPRYAHIGSLIGPMESVLDIGCGTGVLSRYLATQKYFGIDCNQHAVAKRMNGNVVLGDAESYVHPRHVDAIIFNEMLYYTTDPARMLERFSKYLTPSGRIIISIFLKSHTDSLFDQCRVLINKNKPISNRHCAELVFSFILKNHWASEYKEVESEDMRWAIWAARPAK